MKIHTFTSTQDLYQNLAIRLIELIQKPLNIGFATGKTMEPLYQELRALKLCSVKCTGWILDEYLGLPADHPQSYRYFLNEHVFKPLQFSNEQVCFPRLEEMTIEDTIKEYELKFSRAGGLDLQLLGLGLNGHVGLNEPGSNPSDRTRVVDIAELTRKSNLVYFNDLSEVPKQAMTFGLANLMQNKELWLIVTGDKKAEIVKRVVAGESSPEVPATLLKDHSNLHLFLDPAAAKLL